MKIPALLTILCASLALVGCGQKESSSSGASASAAPAGGGPRTIEITAGDNMKFSVTSIEAKPGEELKVVLTNVGTAPIEAMGHNWTLLKAGTDVAAFDAAAAQAKDNGYIPPSLENEIIVHTKLLGPRKSDEVTFKAPDQPGEYPFLCTFPAHYQVGMKGTLTVK